MKTMRVLRIEAGKKPEIVTISPDIAPLQAEVGGPIEFCRPFENDVCLIVNAEGKSRVECLPNRAIMRDGEMVDIICGTIIICGYDGNGIYSLDSGYIQKYYDLFYRPEKFSWINGKTVRSFE